MTIGKIVSVTLPKVESKSYMLTVEIERNDFDKQYVYYFEGPRYDLTFVKREMVESHPELYKVGSICNVRYSRSDDGRYYTNIYF